MVCRKPTLAALLLFLCSSCCSLPLASASVVFNEIADAGDQLSAANVAAGVGPLDAIVGKLIYVDEFTDDSVDMFAIHVDDPSTFSASTNNAGTDLLESWLYLFNDQGYGVAASASSTDGSFNATIGPGSFSGPSGIYYLAVTKFDVVPLSASGAIFPDLFFESIMGEVVGPDGPGGSDPLVSWNAFPLEDFENYRIELTGASLLPPSQAVPEPGALFVWLTLGSLFGLSLARRRRRRG